MPARHDLAVWRGNTLSQQFVFKSDANTPLDLTGSTLVFKILGGGVDIRKTGHSADVSFPIPTNGEVTINLSVADTRAIPEGLVAKYELERRIAGRQETILYGTVSATGWVNDDA